ncbi:T9SS type A sorting domain-containing protein [bacterium]|nr:T9SS type A sorting domain-containing protein [bacterium]
MKLKVLLACTIALTGAASAAYGSGTVWSDVKDNVAYVHHDKAEFNCCPDMFYDIEIAGKIVNIYEKDLCTHPCDCNCEFDFVHKLEGLEAGAYTAKVWEASCDNNYSLAGTTIFNIPEEIPQANNTSIMSECGGWTGAWDDLFPDDIKLSANTPVLNDVTISYILSDVSQVSLIIYDAAGREVRKLDAGTQTAGKHEQVWDTRDNTGARVQRGVYFIMLYAGGSIRTLPLLVLK